MKKLTEPQGPEAPGIPVVVYAAKSSPDEKGSVADQERIVLARIAEEPGRFVYSGPFGEADVSGYRGNRGAKLEAAINAAVEAAGRYGSSELWVFHTSRPARGSGKKDEARSYLKLWADLQAEGVQLRSVTDDDFATNPILVGIASEQNRKYSADISAHVTRGLRRTFAAGNRLGGPVPDGLEKVVQRDERDRVVERTYRPDPERAPVVRLMADLYEQGMGDPSVARELNRRGHRTKAGKPFTRRRVQDTLTNQSYAGRVVYRRGKPDEEVRDGNHPALIEPKRFDRLLELRAARDRAVGSKRAPQRGRPPKNYALGGLARCNRCGGPMDGRTSPYERKDGTHKREYRCRASCDGSGSCEANWGYDAEVVDGAVAVNLDRYIGDFDAWRREIEDGDEAERARLAGEVARAVDDRDEVASLVEKIEREWERKVASEDPAAETILPILDRRRADRAAADLRVGAAEQALASVPEEAPTDAMLDFYNALADAIRGRLTEADTLAKVNDALRDLFECFLLDRTEGEAYVILPVLLESTPLNVTAREDGTVDSNGARRSDLHEGRVTEDNFQTWGGILSRGEERITPPLRAIDAPLAKRALIHE